MKKIYCFYLYGEKNEVNSKIYPGIDGLEIITGNNCNHVLYAWTPNKIIRKQFKAQRDMTKFREVIHEIPKDNFDKFSDEYADTFLEERGVTTKNITENHMIEKKTVYILTTSKELDVMLENDRSFMIKQLECLIESDIYIREEYFSNIYRNALEFFRFDCLLAYTYPLEEDGGLPFNMVTDDNLAIYSHLYYNTYRKDINL